MDENLGMEERVIVVDKYYQKLTDSGYLKEQARKVIVGGLTGYESFLDPSNRKYRPLHESRKYNARGRRITKMLSKQNWFKGKQEVTQSSTRGRGTPYQRDGNTSDERRAA